MLNKNQSKKSNSWKYALVLPVLVAFVIFFQVKVIAQEKESKEVLNYRTKQNSVDVIQITKNTSDSELKDKKEDLKSNYDVTAKFSKVKRNNKGELTSIKVDVKTPKGQSNTYQFSSDEPIKPFSIVVNKSENGIVNVDFHSNSKLTERHSDGDDEFAFSFSDGDDIADIEAPEPPMPPEELETAVEPASPASPAKSCSPIRPKDFKRNVVIKKGAKGSQPEIYINGEKLDVPYADFEKMDKDFDGKFEFSEGENGSYAFNFNDKEMMRMSAEDIEKITKNAMDHAKIEIERHKPEIERARREMRRARPEMERARREMDRSRPEMEQAREEMLRAKAEMEKAKEEMIRARAEMEKARAELKKS